MFKFINFMLIQLVDVIAIIIVVVTIINEEATTVKVDNFIIKEFIQIFTKIIIANFMIIKS